MKKNLLLLVVLVNVICLTTPGSAYANPGLILRGVARTLGAAFEIPRAMMEDSFKSMFPLGLVTGALRGTVKTVTGLVGGGMDIAQGGAPYAKYAAFLL